MLVNNAGITGRIGSFADASADTLRQVTQVNLLGTMFMAQEAVRRWRARDVQGRMVHISSIASTLGAQGEIVHYHATKAGVEQRTKGTGKEVYTRVLRIHRVAPRRGYPSINDAA